MTNTTNYNLKKFNMQDRIDATISGMSSNMDDIDTILESKVDKVEGKALSTNDFTSEEKEKLASLSNYDDSEILESLETKVDKVEGKSLSTNDYTNEDKTKLTDLVEIKSIGENLTLDEDGELSADGGVLPVASSTTLGGIKVGNNLTITADGVLNATGGTSGGEITNASNTNYPIYSIWVGTIEEYEALELIDPNTEYNIIEE